MRLRDYVKKYFPSYRTEKRLTQKLEELNKDMREMDRKNEYLFWLSQMQPGETMQETKKRVFLQMPKATGRLRNIQLAENHILQRVKEICDANCLEMFLIGGTLLGAVRHQGFIPWDNDIDIGMMKSDYLKLREILANDDELYAEFFYNYEAGLKIPKIKYRATDVFWIDVFIFDFIDAAPETAEKVWKATQKANLEHSAKLRELSAPYVHQDICRPCANPELNEKIQVFEAEQYSAFGRMGHGNYFCASLDSPYWCRDPRGMSLVQDRFPLRKNEVTFEGKTYDVWKDYENALTHFYGDFWCLPFSIKEPHTCEFDTGFDEAVAYLKAKGILE